MKSISKKIEYFPCLESLRGIAAIAVLLFHFQDKTLLVYIPFIAHGDIFVDFFFILSGFVIAHVYQGKLREKKDIVLFVKKRFLRLYPLHFFILTFFLINSSIAPNFEFDLEKRLMLLNQYLLVHAIPPFPIFFKALFWNHPSWSISAEFWTYLLFIPLIIRPNKWLALAIAILGYAFIGLKMGTLLDTDIIGDDFLLLRCLAGFSFGVFIYNIYDRFNIALKGVWQDSIVILSIFTIFFFLSYNSDRNVFFAEICLILFFGLLITRAARSDFVFQSLLKKGGFIWIGKISYSIYLSHILIGFYLSRIFLLLFGEYVNLMIVRNIFSFTVLIVCIIFSSLTYKYIERKFRYSNKQEKNPSFLTKNFKKIMTIGKAFFI